MAVPIDTSAPLLLPSQLAALVAAVEKADRDGEHNWIEWKRSLDLTARTSHEHIAKHVLGFGNRLVQTAALHMGGYGYILIGVEPGSILGVETIDPATLTDVIMSYVGTDGPGYHTEYVSVGDRTVLVVVVNPPEHGDPVHTLRKNLGSHKLGQVLVRRTGKTDQAEPGEHRALVDRAKANQNTITVEARAVRSTIEGGPADLREQVESAITAERELMMHPDRSTRPAPKPARTSSWLTGPAPTPFAYAVPRMSFGQPFYEPDERTEDEYADEVERYLDRLRPRLAEHIANHYWRRQGGMLNLALDNLTPRNFAQVWLHVHIAGSPNVAGGTRREDRVPDRPRITPPADGGEEASAVAVRTHAAPQYPPFSAVQLAVVVPFAGLHRARWRVGRHRLRAGTPAPSHGGRTPAGAAARR